MKVTAKLVNIHITPRKTRLVAGLIRGLNVAEAKVQLGKSIKKSAEPLLKLLASAVANAENNFSLKENQLKVAQVIVNEGQKLKRWTPRAQGRATPLWHRLSHVTLILEQRTDLPIEEKELRPTAPKKVTTKKETEKKEPVTAKKEEEKKAAPKAASKKQSEPSK